MFPKRYLAKSYFSGRYFPKNIIVVVVGETAEEFIVLSTPNRENIIAVLGVENVKKAYLEKELMVLIKCGEGEIVLDASAEQKRELLAKLEEKSLLFSAPLEKEITIRVRVLS